MLCWDLAGLKMPYGSRCTSTSNGLAATRATCELSPHALGAAAKRASLLLVTQMSSSVSKKLGAHRAVLSNYCLSAAIAGSF